jgi:hypothetical protein
MKFSSGLLSIALLSLLILQSEARENLQILKCDSKEQIADCNVKSDRESISAEITPGKKMTFGCGVKQSSYQYKYAVTIIGLAFEDLGYELVAYYVPPDRGIANINNDILDGYCGLTRYPLVSSSRMHKLDYLKDPIFRLRYILVSLDRKYLESSLPHEITATYLRGNRLARNWLDRNGYSSKVSVGSVKSSLRMLHAGRSHVHIISVNNFLDGISRTALNRTFYTSASVAEFDVHPVLHSKYRRITDRLNDRVQHYHQKCSDKAQPEVEPEPKCHLLQAFYQDWKRVTIMNQHRDERYLREMQFGAPQSFWGDSRQQKAPIQVEAKGS